MRINIEELTFRPMNKRDLHQVMDIEKKNFEFPWSKKDFLICFEDASTFKIIVVEKNELIVAYMVYELHRNYRRIINFTVAPESREHGIGSELIWRFKKMLKKNRPRIILEVRERNLPAQRFLKKHGFRATELIPDHYEGADESAYVMEFYMDGLKIPFRWRE